MKTLRFGTIISCEDDNSKLQKVQVSGVAGEITSNVENFQPYGFNAVPIKMNKDTGHGAEVILSDISGIGHTAIIGSTDRRYRPRNLFPGDVVLYTCNNGQDGLHRVQLNAGGEGYDTIIQTNTAIIQLKANGEIQITAPGGLFINGDVEINGNVINNGVNISSTHTHSGVQTGGGNTGVPN